MYTTQYERRSHHWRLDHTLWLPDGEVSSSAFKSFHGKSLNQIYAVPYVLDSPVSLREFRAVLPLLSRLNVDEDDEVHALTVSCWDRRTAKNAEKDFLGDYRVSRGRRTVVDSDTTTQKDENNLVQLITKRCGVADDADGAWRVLTFTANTETFIRVTADDTIPITESESSRETIGVDGNERKGSHLPTVGEVSDGTCLKQLKRPYISGSLFSDQQPDSIR